MTEPLTGSTPILDARQITQRFGPLVANEGVDFSIHPGEVHGPAIKLAAGAPSTTVPVPGIDGFYASRLDDLLRTQGRTHLLLAGHGIEAPVHSTMRSANDRGYECLLVTDACTALTDDLGAPSAKQVTMSGGIFGAIGTTDAVLAALSEPVPHLVTPTPQEA